MPRRLILALSVFTLASWGTPAVAQRLVGPVASHNSVPPMFQSSQPSTGHRAAWAVAGALVGAMAGGALGLITGGDRTASASNRRRMNTFLISGATIGAIYGWFKLAGEH